MTNMKFSALAALLLTVGVAPVTAAQDDKLYTTIQPSRDGIGKVYMGREIAQVMGHRGWRWLERPERESEERPDLVIASLDLAPDAVVADIGAGSGYYSFRLQRLVPDGQVLAVDIQTEMLDLIRVRAARDGIENVRPVLGTITDPNLPANGVDAVLLVDAYHEFSHPAEMAAGIVRGLRPGGRVYLLEYRAEDRSVPIKPLHKMTEAQARAEMEAAGLTWIETRGHLPWQHLLVFDKR